MNSAIQKLINIAVAEDGYREKATNANLDSKTANQGENNYTKYARDLDALGNFYNGPKQGYAWCDVFVDWCFVQAFGAETGRQMLYQPTYSTGAGVGYSAQFYKNNNAYYTSNPQPGDQIFFGGDHTGIVYKVDSSYVYTVEGNTGPNAGVVDEGDGVYLKKYSINNGYGYGRPNWSLAEVVSDPKRIWDYFKAKLGNEYGVAGLMGNLEAESDLCPYRVQGDFSTGYADSKAYTARVDSLSISKNDFINNGPGGGGYGLAQWTYSTRKQGLYERWQGGSYSSIGSLDLAMDYLWFELQTSFPGVLSVLKTATSVREASDKVLHDFESPADQSTTVEIKRAAMGQAWYDKYHGSAPGGGDEPDEPDTPSNPPWKPEYKKSMSLLLMVAASQGRR